MKLEKVYLSYSPGLKKLLEEEVKNITPSLTPKSAAGVLEIQSITPELLSDIVLRSRLCSRVLIPVKSFHAWGAEDLYDQCREIDWSQYIHSDQSFGIFAHGKTEDCDYNLNFGTLRVKDALVDCFKDKNKPRPNVDRNNPDLRLELHFFNGHVELSADLLGRPLHRRGYRLEEGPAPLRESRAAALLNYSGYTGQEDLCDPFCGSGTIAIEAALQSIGRIPGTHRKWRSTIPQFTPLNTILEEKQKTYAAQERDIEKLQIYAYDRDPEQIARAEANAKRAGVEDLIKFRVQKAQHLSFKGQIVCNPPYGERMDERGYATKLLNQVLEQFQNKCIGSKLSWVVPKHLLEGTQKTKGPKEILKVPAAKIDSYFASYQF